MRHLRAALPFLWLFVVGTNPLSAMTVKELKTNLRSPDQTIVKGAKLYLAGVAEGIMASNAGAEATAKVSLFCQPRLLSLNTDNFIEMINTYVTKLSDRATKEKLEDFDVSTVLYNSLVDTFPCSEKK